MKLYVSLLNVLLNPLAFVLHRRFGILRNNRESSFFTVQRSLYRMFIVANTKSLLLATVTYGFGVLITLILLEAKDLIGAG